ncbi:hypothetical protein [Nitrospira lenta]|uniref:hypothetical protein n=1 Tax=Nitrospira lenta TaxID=1436998 RepID=UPI0015E8C047|nr:hypothetical protein [Nitrospira lenta]
MTVQEGIHPIHRSYFLSGQLHAAALAIHPKDSNLGDAERAFSLGQFEKEGEFHPLFESPGAREAEPMAAKVNDGRVSHHNLLAVRA